MIPVVQGARVKRMPLCSHQHPILTVPRLTTYLHDPTTLPNRKRYVVFVLQSCHPTRADVPGSGIRDGDGAEQDSRVTHLFSSSLEAGLVGMSNEYGISYGAGVLV